MMESGKFYRNFFIQLAVPVEYYDLLEQVSLCAPIIEVENKRFVASYGFIDTHWG